MIQCEKENNTIWPARWTFQPLSFKLTLIPGSSSKNIYIQIHKLRILLTIYSHLKPMHNIGKLSVNASILYKNKEITGTCT